MCINFFALPFDIATAPLEFTVIAKEVKLLVLSKGIRIHIYLDDWLIRADTEAQFLLDCQNLVQLVQQLGWVINLEKSELITSQCLDFLGYHFQLEKGLLFPTTKKLEFTHKKLCCSRKFFLSQLGSSCHSYISGPLRRLHLRHFQWHLKSTSEVSSCNSGSSTTVEMVGDERQSHEGFPTTS